MEEVIVKDLGAINYQKAWDYQQTLLDELVKIKRANRDAEFPEKQKHYFLFCDHPPVYTLGKSGSKENLLLTDEQILTKGIQFFKINRGGDITYHGPGQIVGYPIFDLECFFTDVHKYVRYIEEAIIKMLADYNIDGGRIEGYTGVWLLPNEGQKKRKICAIGVHLSRWVTMHGFALNVNTDLGYFDNIIPCGIQEEDKEVTSMAKELGKEVDEQKVKEKIVHYFAELFKFEVLK